MMSKKAMVIVAFMVVLLEALTLWRDWRWCSFGVLVIFSAYSFVCAWKRRSTEETYKPEEAKEKKIRIWSCILVAIFIETAIVIASEIFAIPSFIRFIMIGGCTGVVAIIIVVKIVKKRKKKRISTSLTPAEIEEARARRRDIESVNEAMKKGLI